MALLLLIAQCHHVPYILTINQTAHTRYTYFLSSRATFYCVKKIDKKRGAQSPSSNIPAIWIRHLAQQEHTTYRFVSRLRNKPSPASPAPNSSMVEGSGTGLGSGLGMDPPSRVRTDLAKATAQY